ncbi:MAG: hypothetical protein PHQ34_06595 [Methanothrix sp.]|nr:hypothetical protein [Methanothrix sp.]
MKLILFGLLIAALIFAAQGATWSGAVKTDSNSWSISRESSNLSFTCEQSVKGNISPVEYRYGTLSPYHSKYQDLMVNDVGIKERTAALEGSLSSEEQLSLKSHINNSVNMTIYKPSGSDLYTIDFYEKWPVQFIYEESLNYSGKEINNLQFVENNHDYVTANFLYNHKFSREQDLNMSLERMNATVFATDEEIESGAVKATRDTQYKLKTHSTGIANFKWGQVDEDLNIDNAGDEQFAGDYNIVKNIRMKSRYDLVKKEDSWLPCCSGGYLTMNPIEQKDLISARGVFDCSCFDVPSKAQFQE